MALSERQLALVNRLLDEIDAAMVDHDWATLRERVATVLAIDPENADALAALATAERGPDARKRTLPASDLPALDTPASASPVAAAPPPTPSSFVNGRYHVRRFLGEGGKKRVFLARDNSLDRDVAFALIKTDGLDAVGRERIVREAQAMGRLGTHPHVVTIFEIGEEQGAPFVVTELMGGGDVEGLLENGPLPLARTLEIAIDVCRGLEFAHQNEIVHRDLKPGNVWLTSDGVAKIGDFGLAVSLDRSRLTQHGMMVGTVSYMPPEQALGAPTTKQADLYSLGAMLYELVTGHPPFLGEDPTAVISQHINTPPVAPSWESKHCPAALEELILQLLAKVPADRPGSAHEVLEALERIDPNAEGQRHSGSGANPLERLARGVFVGRERELERLRSVIDDAVSGRGSVVMLAGEPGIGKTRAAQEIETYARLRNAQVLWGRANESGGAPPYFPWVQIGRAYRAQNPDETRKKEWAPYVAELQRIFPGLRDLFPDLGDPPPVDSEEAQFALFDAMSAFLRDVSARVPLVLMLDDLHWADRATLQMMSHLARELSHSRICVVGTYRDTDLDRTHPLSQTLAEFNREQLFSRISLRGLTRDDVAAYIAAVAHLEASPALVSQIYEETEGNPFFLSEIVNLLAQEGTFSRGGEISVTDLSIPEGVKEALGRRLDKLRPEANALLQLAAIAGREFDQALLVALSGKSDDEVLELLEDSLSGRVIEETGIFGEYRFTHALMQETLAAELSSARQVRMHGQIADALEAMDAGTTTNPAELALHYTESAVMSITHAQKAAHYSRLAAEAATASFAWDEAARHYRNCLALVQSAPDRLGQDEVEVLISLALAEFRNGFNGFLETIDRAVAVGEQDSDPLRRARPWFALRKVYFAPQQLVQRLPTFDRALLALGEEDSVERCVLLALRASALPDSRGDADATAAGEMAARLGSDVADRHLETRAVRRAYGRGDFETAYAIADTATAELLTMKRADESSLTMLNYKRVMALMLGDPRRTNDAAEQMLVVFRERHQMHGEANIRAQRAWFAFSRGEIDSYEPQGLLPVFQTQYVQVQIALARVDVPAALRVLESPDWAARMDWNGGTGLRVRARHAAGDDEGARRAFDAWTDDWRSGRFGPVLSCGSALCWADDAVFMFGTPELRAEIYEYLEGYPAMRLAVWGGPSPDHLRGMLALELGRTEDAEAHFRTGLEWAMRPDVGFLIDAGRHHQGLAEVAELRGELEAAAEHLDASTELFARHGGAKLYLDQVLSKKEILKA
jgi:hypothetical protein